MDKNETNTNTNQHEQYFIRPSFKQNLLFVLKECGFIDENATEKDVIEYMSKQSDGEKGTHQLLRYFVNILNNLFFIRGLTYEDVKISATHKNSNMYFIVSKSKSKDPNKQLAVIYNTYSGFQKTHLDKFFKEFPEYTACQQIFSVSVKSTVQQIPGVIQIKITNFVRNIIEENMFQPPEVVDSIELYKGIPQKNFPLIHSTDPMVIFLNAKIGQFIIVRFVENIGSLTITTEIRKVVQ